jgi:lysophospholipase L1-like esterase
MTDYSEQFSVKLGITRRLFTSLLLTLAVGIGLVAAPDSFAGAPERWIPTWTTSTASAPATVAFENQTLREIVHTSIGGSRVRVRFSNTLGTETLWINAAHVALRAQESAIVPGTDRELTFGGEQAVLIPNGAVAVSDPVNLDVPAQADLAISVYVAGNFGPPSTHGTALETSFISTPGNFTAAQVMPVGSTITRSWYYLADVEVTASADTRVLVTLGDSITDGTSSTPDTNQRWPDLLFQRLMDAGKNMAVANQGISGNRVLHEGAGPNALARFDRDVLSHNGVTHVIVLEGINDIGQSFRNPAQAVNAAQLIQGYRQLIARAHLKGLMIIGATLTPYEGAGYYSEPGEMDRQTLNDFIRNSGEFDGVIDFDMATRDPANPRRFFPAYNSGDNLHPNDAGYRAMANSIDLSLF